MDYIYVNQNGTLVGPFANVLAAKLEVIRNCGYIVYRLT